MAHNHLTVVPEGSRDDDEGEQDDNEVKPNYGTLS
jgi:hypothetical protein